MQVTVADPEGVQWVPWNPSFEGLPLQTYYVHYAHTRAAHFSFTVAITHDLPRNNCIKNLTHAWPTCTLYYQIHKHMTTIETMSEARERIKAKVLS